MAEDKKKSLLLDAAAELLKASEEPDRVTSREIAAKAGVNAALCRKAFLRGYFLLCRRLDKEKSFPRVGVRRRQCFSE